MSMTPEQQERFLELKMKQKVHDTQRLEQLRAKKASSEARYRVLKEKEQVAAVQEVNNTVSEGINQMVKPFKRTAQIYRREFTEGRGLVAKGISREKQSTWERVKNIGFGTAQYAFAPLTGVAKGLVGEPVTEASQAASGMMDKMPKPMLDILKQSPIGPGITLIHEAPEFVGKLSEEAVYFIPFGSSIRQKMLRGKPGLEAAQSKGAIPKEKRVAGVTEEVAAERAVARKEISEAPKPGMASEPAELVRPGLKEVHVEEAVEGALDVLKKRGTTDETRLFKQVGEELAMGNIELPFLKEIAQKRGWDNAQIAKVLEDTVSYGARNMSKLSRLRKELDGIFKDQPEVMQLLEKSFEAEASRPYLIDKAFDMLGRAGNLWRASLVSQVATAMRNGWSQAGRLSISALDEALQGVISKSVGGAEKLTTSQIGKATINEIGRDFNKAMSAMRLMKPKNKDQLLKLLDDKQGVLSKARLFSQGVHEVSLGSKYANLINTLNRTQEFFFRRIAFEAKTRQSLKKHGLDFDTVDVQHIPDNLLEDSVNYALEMTFAASPKSKAMQKFVKTWTDSPLLLVNPFPRFNFGNAIPFAFEHSPLGYLHAIKPSTLKKLANGDTKDFSKYASRATLGSMALDSAIRFRQSKHAGEKWHEIKIGKDEKGRDKTVSTLAYAPMSAPLFIAEAFVNPERLTPTDYAKMVIGLNRISGTGLVALDAIRAKTGDSLKKQVKNFVGQHIASWLTPVRQFSDFYSGVDDEENIMRDWRQDPLIAPIVLNLPKYSQMVPEKKSMTSIERMKKGEDVTVVGKKIPAGLFRQLSGVTIRTKNIVEQEIDKTGFNYIRALPKTGDAEADRRMSEYMAPIVEKLSDEIITKNKRYRSFSIEAKREVLGAIFSYSKEIARKKLSVKNPELALRVKLGAFNRNQKIMIERLLQGGQK